VKLAAAAIKTGEPVRHSAPVGDVKRRVAQDPTARASFDIHQIVIAVELLIEDRPEPQTIALR